MMDRSGKCSENALFKICSFVYLRGIQKWLENSLWLDRDTSKIQGKSLHKLAPVTITYLFCNPDSQSPRPPPHPYPHSEYPGKRTRDCKGVTRIGGGGSLCVKQRVLTRLLNRTLRHISLNETKRLTKGESRAPRIPPSHTLG